MKTWIFDCDGVLYLDDTAVPGAGEVLERLQQRGDQVLFCTNNSARTPDHLIEKLYRLLGFRVDVSQVVTSALVAAHELVMREVGTAAVLGMDGIRHALLSKGVEIVDGPAEAVVVGLDFEVDFGRIRAAADLVRSGALFVASNTDATFPVPGGVWPGAGTIVAAVSTAGGRGPDVVTGKPHRPMIAMLEALVVGDSVSVVGDRPETDLAMALTAGWEAICVETGIVRSAADIPERYAPDRLIAAVTDLL